jgi:hypothetical protein
MKRMTVRKPDNAMTWVYPKLPSTCVWFGREGKKIGFSHTARDVMMVGMMTRHCESRLASVQSWTLQLSLVLPCYNYSRCLSDRGINSKPHGALLIQHPNALCTCSLQHGSLPFGPHHFWYIPEASSAPSEFLRRTHQWSWPILSLKSRTVMPLTSLATERTESLGLTCQLAQILFGWVARMSVIL